MQLFWNKLKNYKLRHLKLGKVVYDGKSFNDDSFRIEGISWNISWQVDRYLAIIIRDYIRFHVQESPAIGNCVLRDNPEGIPYEDFLSNKEPDDIDYGKRWRDLALGVADEFDELRIMLEKPDDSDHDGKKLQEKINAAFKNLAYIFSDLGW